MKSAEDIDKFINFRIDRILRYPLAHTDTPLGIESMILGLIQTRRFIRGYEDDDRHVIDKWVMYATGELGYIGARPVANVMRDGNLLGDGWEKLTEMLRGFSYLML